jgi:hypothetical protein
MKDYSYVEKSCFHEMKQGSDVMMNEKLVDISDFFPSVIIDAEPGTKLELV